jgi:hypothetical protein
VRAPLSGFFPNTGVLAARSKGARRQKQKNEWVVASFARFIQPLDSRFRGNDGGAIAWDGGDLHGQSPLPQGEG